jgi:MarR family 2-MHQ and catechol resistance regulon transcriptional repressor
MGTHFQGTKEEIRALNAFIKLIRAASSVSARVEEHFSSIGLTGSQFGILEALYHLGPLYQKDLAAKLLKSTGNVTMVVDNLEKRGYVERVRDETDRRHFFVKLTTEGEKRIRSIFPIHVKRIVREMGRLDRKEQEALGRLCKKVGLASDN